MSKSSSLLSCLLLAACGAPPLARSPAEPGERVGTYDGRAVAVAYANGPRFAAWMREVQAAHEAAEARGDQGEMRALEQRAAAQQQRFHEQAFEGADIGDILDLVEGELAAVRAAADVGRLEKVNLARVDGVVTVDVTDQLVDLFEPSAQGRKWIRDLRGLPFPR